MLAGSGLVALGTYLARATRQRLVVRLGAFGLTVVGVVALWGFSWVGGLGGEGGLSMWWGLLVVPYLVGWIVGIWAQDSPIWVLWIGMLVGGWWAALTGFAMVAVELEGSGSQAPLLVLGGLGVVTIVGCVVRLVLPSPQPTPGSDP
jgi:hypothetical protein